MPENWRNARIFRMDHRQTTEINEFNFFVLNTQY